MKSSIRILILLSVAGNLAATVIQCYTPNPRAIHPNGRVPTIAEARQKLPFVQEALMQSKNKDGFPPLILIDGNNIRNSFGYRSVSALNLTQILSKSDTYSLLTGVICVWDGGETVACDWANSTLALFSGPNQSADDLLVQCCAFLYRQRYCRNIIVFTSDANLANRCKMQMVNMDTGIKCPSQSMRDVGYNIFHSIYLCLLLNDGVDLGQSMWTPDWERLERRSSVNELQSQLNDRRREMRTKIIQSPDEVGGMEDIKKWINEGRPGLQIGRVTKGGSILYKMEVEL